MDTIWPIPPFIDTSFSALSPSLLLTRFWSFNERYHSRFITLVLSLVLSVSLSSLSRQTTGMPPKEALAPKLVSPFYSWNTTTKTLNNMTNQSDTDK